MAYDFGGRSNDGSSMGAGGIGIPNERDRVQMNLDKAFSLLDDDRPKPVSHYYGEQRIGTAPAGGGPGSYGLGGGPAKSNYTGSDLGSEIGDTNS